MKFCYQTFGSTRLASEILLFSCIFGTDSSSFTGGFLTGFVQTMSTSWWAVNLPRDSSLQRRWLIFLGTWKCHAVTHFVWRWVRAGSHCLRGCRVQCLEPLQQHSVQWRGFMNGPCCRLVWLEALLKDAYWAKSLPVGKNITSCKMGNFTAVF